MYPSKHKIKELIMEKTMSEQVVAEFVDMSQLKQLMELKNQASFSKKEAELAALKAENDQLKLHSLQLEMKLLYKLSDKDSVDLATGAITRK